jgi:predicted lipid-binding transport protein (Tim44 family)
MKLLVTTLVVSVFLLGMTPDFAHAKRLGGGNSFGSKQSHSEPVQRNAAADVKPQNATSAPAGAASAAPAARSGMGGMLGGLLAGGLLGALFFGGAFENIGLLDILLLAGIGYGVYRLFAARRAAQMPAAAAAGYPGAAPTSLAPDTDAPASTSYPNAGRAARNTADPLQVNRNYPAGFDAAAFLEGAEKAYRRLQAAWDSGDLAQVRELSTDAVFAEIQDQYRARQGENLSEIRRLKTDLLEVIERDSELEARVSFEAEMVERDANSPVLVEPTVVREIWYFVKPTRAARPTWYLDGIRQVV